MAENVISSTMEIHKRIRSRMGRKGGPNEGHEIAEGLSHSTDDDGPNRAVVKLQRAFRRMIYRFDRLALVDRLRLELRLQVVGGRVLVWLTLLILVGLNLMSTNDSSNYVFGLGSTLRTELRIDSLHEVGESWSDVYAWMDDELPILYGLGVQSDPPPSPQFISEEGIEGIPKSSNFAVSTWMPVMYATRTLVASPCWRLDIIKSRGLVVWTNTESGVEEELSILGFSTSSSMTFFTFMFSQDTMNVSVNGLDVGKLVLPPSASSSTTVKLFSTVGGAYFDGFYFYDSHPEGVVDTYASRHPFITTNSSTYTYQSVPPLMEGGGDSKFRLVFPGLISVSPATDSGPVSRGMWVFPLNISGALVDHGFTGESYSKLLSDLFPNELNLIAPRTEIRLVVIAQILEVDKLVMYEILWGGPNPGVKTYQVFLPSAPGVGSRKLFTATAIVGISVSGFFLLKDILVFLVNIFVWSTEEREYVKHQVSGVIGTRTKQVVWMLSNVITNASVLVLLIGRLANGVLSDNVVGYLDRLVGATVESVTTTVDELIVTFSAFSRFESLGIIVLYLLVARVIHSLSGHPRVGILTSTWRSASDDMIHLSVNFIVLFFAQAVIGWILMSDRTVLMGSYGQVLLSQWNTLVSGTWDASIEGSEPPISTHGNDWYIILYFCIFLASTRICLLNFFIAILIDAYMAVRKVVEKSDTVQSFPRDVMDTAESNFLVKAGYLPNKQDVIALLLGMYATEDVGIEALGNSSVFDGGIDGRTGEYVFTGKLQNFCWRYWKKYEYLRKQREEESSETSSADWRQIIAEIEVMKYIIDQIDEQAI
jgi:cytochrome b561